MKALVRGHDLATRAWQRIRLLLATTDGLLVLANLATRALGFLVSLLLARTAGLSMLGAYSSLLISSSSPVTPLSLPLANSATLMASRHASTHGLRAVGAAHWQVTGLFSLVGAAGACGLVLLANHGNEQLGAAIPLAWSLIAVSLLAMSQLLTQFAVGLYHGGQQGLDCARAIGGTMLLALLLCVPAVYVLGVKGALAVAVFAAAGPGLWLIWRLWRQARMPGQASTAPSRDGDLPREARLRVQQALPSVVSTVIRNGTSWFCCIYLAGLFHGPEGVGLVTIGFQWMMLMQLPISSWGGRIVSDLGMANDQASDHFNASLRHWFRKCMLVTTVSSVAVALCFPVLSHLYKVDPWHMTALMCVNAVASILAAATYVFERAAFCLQRQRAWLWLSAAADTAQIVFTLALASHSLLFIVAGPILSAALLMIAAKTFILPRTLRRTPAP